MDKLTQWRDKYKGINFVIKNWGVDDEFTMHTLNMPSGRWAYYIYVHLDALPDEVRERFWLEGSRDKLTGRHVYYDYYGESLISDLPFHGGITWYCKKSGFDGASRVVELGCDYQHLWDEHHYYNEEMLQFDAKRTIDALYDAIPDLKVWCTWCGEYFETEDKEVVRCDPCEIKREEEKKKREEEKANELLQSE